jgi:hypothetical protein
LHAIPHFPALQVALPFGSPGQGVQLVPQLAGLSFGAH